MITKPDKNKTRQKRHRRVRNKISGTAECPRLNVFRSNKNIYAQVIDDVAGVTLASASTVEKEFTAEDKTSVYLSDIVELTYKTTGTNYDEIVPTLSTTATNSSNVKLFS